MPRRFFTEALGWYGVAAIISAYALLSFSIVRADSLLFQILNLTGAIGIVTDSLPDRNWQPIVLNLIWATIALLALSRILF